MRPSSSTLPSSPTTVPTARTTSPRSTTPVACWTSGYRVRGVEGMELRVDVAQERVAAATAVVGAGAVQIQPFAAPRTTGIWDDVRAEILSSVTAAGGHAEEVDGPFGVEVKADVLATVDGKQSRQRARFVGIDGPRWLLRGVFTGGAVDDPVVAAPLEQAFRSVVVVRGDAPMPPREPIELRLPAAGVAGAQATPPQSSRILSLSAAENRCSVSRSTMNPAILDGWLLAEHRPRKPAAVAVLRVRFAGSPPTTPSSRQRSCVKMSRRKAPRPLPSAVTASESRSSGPCARSRCGPGRRPRARGGAVDGTAGVSLIWLCAADPRIEPGPRLSVEGLVQVMDDARVIFNPRTCSSPRAPSDRSEPTSTAGQRERAARRAGGWCGLIDTALLGIVFVVAFLASGRELNLALIAAIATAAVLLSSGCCVATRSSTRCPVSLA